MQNDSPETMEMVDRAEGSSRKRPRLDDSDATGKPEDPIVMAEVLPIVKDELYYRADGDSVIRVENVLFKVHRFLLERDLSTFANMFSMPQGDSAYAPFSDENPLILYDEADDFRALCWIIYALPTVYLEQMSELTADIEKLVSCLIIVHKYHFESHEEWARDLLQDHCREVDALPVSDYFLNCPSSRLEELLRIAHRGDTPSFRKSIRIIWLYRLKEKPEESTTSALSVAEELGDRKFQAAIYYNELTRMKVTQPDKSTAHICPPNDLATHQKLALYQGFWSLQHYWNHTLKTCLRQRFTCPSAAHICNQEWKRIWREYASKRLEVRFDPIKILDDMAHELETTVGGEVVCVANKLSVMSRLLDDTLDDHFLGPIEPAVIIVD